ncbi:MAG: FHA domain-containing protein, partial [Deltaproteobacteria bacterium]
MAVLRFVQDDGVPAEVFVDAQNPIVKIGRANECEIRTRNSTVSRRHCQVVFTGSSFKLYDLNSSNGTYFNRERVTEHTLTSGDIFFCGNYEISFEEAEVVVEPAPAPPPPEPPARV